jgi:putative transposase
MPRQPRLIVPGIAAHVVQRGNNRNSCFRETSDYLVYLMHLRELSEELGCVVHAYCLMTNHVHLLVTPRTDDGCSMLMRNLGQRYVQYFNRHHDRTGTLWEGRFRSCIAESARYVLACYRYIEMNPVRAGMVAMPGAYPWSSHGGNVGARVDALLTPHPEYAALGRNAEASQAAYQHLFAPLSDGDLEEIRRATSGGYPLISDAMKERLGLAGKRLGPARDGRPSKGQAKTGL